MRVFLTGAYKNGVGRGQQREINWVIGVVMFLTTLFLSFTGYLLPWDQLAFWAVTVGTNIASSIPHVGPSVRELLIGGRTIEQATLIRFYVLHVCFCQGCSACCSPITCGVCEKTGGWRAPTRASWRHRSPHRDRPTKTYTLLGVARGTAPTVTRNVGSGRHTVNAVPDLMRRAAIATLGTIAVVSIMAVFIASPLEEPANALLTPNPAKAPWYFLWLQEIVTDTTIRIGSFTLNGAFVGGVILPGLLVGLMTCWPWIDRSSHLAAGVWLPQRPPLAEFRFLVIVLFVLALTVVGMVLRGPYWNFYWPWETWPDLPGGSEMEQRTSSPYPRVDRLVLAIVGVVLVIGTGLFMWSDRAHDWRYYQFQFKQMVAEKFGEDKAAVVPAGVQQVWADGSCRAPTAASPSTRQ